MPSASPCPEGRCTSGVCWRPAGVRYVVVVDTLSTSWWGPTPASVSAPPPPGLDADLLEQDDLQVVPGVLGVQVYENGDDMPVTAAQRRDCRHAPLRIRPRQT